MLTHLKCQNDNFQLRDYQIAALDSVKDHIARGMRRLLVALPTGTGKTVVFSHLPGWLGLRGRWLVLAHREELLDQALRKFQTVNPGLRCAIEQSDRHAGDADVIIASVPTLQRARLAAINPDEFAGVIVDEAHHSVADSYHRIFDHFGLFDESNDKPLIGFTATPKRGDEIGLSAVFEAITYEATLRDMIKAGYLSDISGIRINTGVSLSDVQVRCGEFVHNQLAQAVDTDERNALIFRSYREYAPGRRALVFCVGVDHAVRLTETFQAAGIRAASVSGETPKEERKNILERFSAGELDVLANCGMLTEGYDEPRVDCILMARPTKSSLLYTQIIGRGTRLHPDKSDCLVLDFVDASTKHSVHSVATLFGLPPSLNLAGKKALKTKEQLELTEEQYPWIDLSQLRHVDDSKLLCGWVSIPLKSISRSSVSRSPVPVKAIRIGAKRRWY